MDFSFETAGRILFGAGRRRELPELALSLGKAPLVLAGRDQARVEFLIQALSERGAKPEVGSVSGEPSVARVLELTELARSAERDVIIAVGGGSVIDAAKAVAALLANPGHPLDYLEVVGAGKPLKNRSLPVIAVPTTAGTGAEVTKNAVIDVPEREVKVSLRSATMLPPVALLDPELTLSVPPDITRATGFDALTQVIEPFLSSARTPMTDALCREGIRRGASALSRVLRDGSDLEARSEMMLTSLFGGMALANAKLGAVHGFAGPLGGLSHAPHGALCAALLPASLRVNLRALRARGEACHLERFRELAALLTGKEDAQPEDAVSRIEELTKELRVVPLSGLGVSRELALRSVPMARRASSMKGNPIELTDEELEELVTSA